jgi:hypothetical protein
MRGWREGINAPVPTEFNPEYDLQHAPESYITWADVEDAL